MRNFAGGDDLGQLQLARHCVEPLAACQEQHCCHGQADRNPVRLSERDWTKQISEQIADGNGEPDIRHALCVALCHGAAVIGMEPRTQHEHPYRDGDEMGPSSR